jgi:DNA-binding transcriptional MocR family regulator
MIPLKPLPPVRTLAQTLRVSPSTVAAAYRGLRERGYVVTDGRRGTRVAPAAPTRLHHATTVVDDETVDLATGNPDPALLPPLEPALRAIAGGIGLYEPAPNLAELLAFASSEFEADGIPTAAMTVVGGGLDGIERILREEARPGDAVAVEDPAFPGLLDLLAAGGLRPAPFAIDEDGPLPDALSAVLSVARVAVVTPRAQNPTGAALTENRVNLLRRVLEAHPHALVIEDDYAGPVAGAPLFTLCDGSRARWASVRSVTKWLGADLRLALLAGDGLTIGRVAGRQALGTRWVSRILQRAALAVWSDPSSGRRLARASDAYAQRRSALLKVLGRRGIVARGRSGFNVWVPVRDEAAVVRALGARGWSVAAGRRFRVRADPGVRVTVAALPVSAVERFAADLALAIDGSDDPVIV